MEKILIIGSDGRAHAIGESMLEDKEVEEIIYAPGNGGTTTERSRNVPVNITSGKTVEERQAKFPELVEIIKKENVSMVVVSPEQPLADGLVDYLHENGITRVVGTKKNGAQIESKKFYSYDIIEKAGVPQAEARKCYGVEQVITLLNKWPIREGVVVKANDLTGGKGVFVYDNPKHALVNVRKDMNSLPSLEVLVAERLHGEEISVFAYVDSKGNVTPIEISTQDHKRLLDNDNGPNTGGMGAYGPVGIADANMVRYIVEKVMTPVINTMRDRGDDYTGFLYAGMMMTKDGSKIVPKVLEFNCRLGDPETEPVAMMLKNGLYQPLSAALDGRSKDVHFELKNGTACTVVMAANGYPSSKKIEKGFEIGGFDEVAKLTGVKVYHAGTAINENGKIAAAGGRVLMVSAYSPLGINDAVNMAYQAVDIIDVRTREINEWKQMFTYRHDIAAKALGR